MKNARQVYAVLLLAACLPVQAALARDALPAGIGKAFLAADAPPPAPLPARESAPESDDWKLRIQQLQFEYGPYHPGLAETVLDAAEASAADVVRRLSQRLKMVDSRLEVPAPEPGIRRNVVLVVKAHAHAVNFS